MVNVCATVYAPASAYRSDREIKYEFMVRYISKKRSTGKVIAVQMSAHPIKAFCREICRPGKRFCWTTDATSDTPFVLIEFADVLSKCADSTCALSGSSTRLALRIVKKSMYYDARVRLLM